MNHSNQRNAGIWPRLMAHNIDLTILLPILFGLRLLIEKEITLFVTGASLIFLYEAIFITSDWKATPGKKLLKIEVLTHENEQLAIHHTMIRTLTKGLLVLLLPIQLLIITFHPNKKSLHDIICKTTVILNSHK